MASPLLFRPSTATSTTPNPSSRIATASAPRITMLEKRRAGRLLVMKATRSWRGGSKSGTPWLRWQGGVLVLRRVMRRRWRGRRGQRGRGQHSSGDQWVRGLGIAGLRALRRLILSIVLRSERASLLMASRTITTTWSRMGNINPYTRNTWFR